MGSARGGGLGGEHRAEHVSVVSRLVVLSDHRMSTGILAADVGLEHQALE